WREMVEAVKAYKKGVVMAGGLVGVEGGKGLVRVGMEVRVVDVMEDLMEREVDWMGWGMVEREVEGEGMGLLLGKERREMMGDERVRGVGLK
ncbi:NAD-binding protein, partial [Paenibacillus sp. Y412MC10]|uniref:NAD-binding protein n=1 Tax=Geobacillus sp. (strain Y412MC10) TaxID=481743 RepID=UPI0037CB829E